MRSAQNLERVDEAYFESTMMEVYAESSVTSAATCILNACLADDFWDQVSSSSPLTIDYSATRQSIRRLDEVKRLALKAQFFLGQINIYCQAHGLSTINFGTVFDSELYLERVANCITTALLNNANVEAAIFDLIHGMRPALGLSRQLTADEQANLIRAFRLEYNIIKDTPHFDEFILFRPEVRGIFLTIKIEYLCIF